MFVAPKDINQAKDGETTVRCDWRDCKWNPINETSIEILVNY